jgi:SH3-like domain-containing protein
MMFFYQFPKITPFSPQKITILIVIFSLLFALPAWAAMKSTAGEKTPVHTGPGENYSIKWEYGSGFPVKILRKKGEWTEIEDFENDRGWIQSNQLNNRPHVIVKANRGKNKTINLRSGPGTKYKVIGQAYYGVVLIRKEQKKSWVKVKHESGLEGWAETTFLWGF